MIQDLKRYLPGEILSINNLYCIITFVGRDFHCVDGISFHRDMQIFSACTSASDSVIQLVQTISAMWNCGCQAVYLVQLCRLRLGGMRIKARICR